MRQLIYFALLICHCTVFSQTGTPINAPSSETIQNNALKAFVQHFKAEQCPFQIKHPADENIIDIELMNRLLKLDIELEEVGLDEYYYGSVFYDTNFFGLIITHYYSPGAFGIENYFIELITVSYEGKLINREDLGCFCNDTNMGSNDYTATEVEINIDAQKIIVHETFTHATLHEQEGEEPFEHVTHRKIEFELSPTGELSKVAEE